MTILPRSMKTVVSASVAIMLLLTVAGVATAAVIGSGVIILAPASVLNSDLTVGASNLDIDGVEERYARLQEQLLGAGVDAGVNPAGTVVDSHMIFLNEPDLALESVAGWYCLVRVHFPPG